MISLMDPLTYTKSDYLIRIAMFNRLGSYVLMDMFVDEYIAWATTE